MPMLNSNEWRKPAMTRTFDEDLEQLRTFIHEYGYRSMELAVLEWNIAPVKKGRQPPNPHQTALIQAEMLMQFIEGGALMTAIWPTFWQVTPPGQTEPAVADGADGTFRSIFKHQQPYDTTPTYDMFRLFLDIPGSVLVESVFEMPGLYRQTYRIDDGTMVQLVLNKSMEPQPHALGASAGREVRYARIGLEGMETGTVHASDTLVLPAYSLTRLEVSD
jgi:hypothetical protein